MGRKKVEEVRKQRTIRLTDAEWEVFKKLKLLDVVKDLIRNNK